MTDRECSILAMELTSVLSKYLREGQYQPAMLAIHECLKETSVPKFWQSAIPSEKVVNTYQDKHLLNLFNDIDDSEDN